MNVQAMSGSITKNIQPEIYADRIHLSRQAKKLR